MTYQDKPDERLLAHFKENTRVTHNTLKSRAYLKSLGFIVFAAGTENEKAWPYLIVEGYEYFCGRKNKKDSDYLRTLDQLKAEVAEVLGESVPTEPVEKPLSRQKFVTTAKKLEMLNGIIRNLEQQIEDTKAEISDTFKILREADNVRFKDEGVGVEAYEWSDDGFKTYTGRKV